MTGGMLNGLVRHAEFNHVAGLELNVVAVEEAFGVELNLLVGSPNDDELRILGGIVAGGHNGLSQGQTLVPFHRWIVEGADEFDVGFGLLMLHLGKRVALAGHVGEARLGLCLRFGNAAGTHKEKGRCDDH